MDSGSQHLVKMANQIGSFFEAQSLADPQAAAKAVASHLKMFWAPSMRIRLIEDLDEGHADGLDPIVATALRTHRQSLLGAARASEGEKQESFPEGGGDAG